MELNQLLNDFEIKKISKSEYISKMHNIHKVLFDYSEFIKSTDIKNIEISDGKVILTTRNNSIRLLADKDDARIIPIEIINFKIYEPEILDIMKKLIPSNGTFFDIGANIGWYSLNMKKLYSDLNIYAFEPVPKTFNYLITNLELNSLNGVKTFNFGFSNQEGKFDIYYYPQVSGNASLSNLSGNENVEKISCTIKRLDDFIKTESIENIDFIKCDVEGAEFSVLKGAKETIVKFQPIILIELLRKWAAKFNYHPNDVIEYLAKLNYQVYTIVDEKLVSFGKVTDNTIETNYVFLNREKHKKWIDKFK
jgi:FkbM family methyltransferase